MQSAGLTYADCSVAEAAYNKGSHPVTESPVVWPTHKDERNEYRNG